MSEWQDIETAPKDGRWILAYDAASPYASFGLEEVMHMVQYDNGSWRIAMDGQHCQPTHWQPLPELPRKPVVAPMTGTGERAKAGDGVTVVIAINGDNERTAIFSTPETAQVWMDKQADDWTCICVETMVVDVPEFGNEAQSNLS